MTLALALTLTLTPILTFNPKCNPNQAEAALHEGVWRAADGGDAQAVAAWLDEGGGVDARCAEHYGATLLMAAALGGQEAMVRMLLQRDRKSVV